MTTRTLLLIITVAVLATVGFLTALLLGIIRVSPKAAAMFDTNPEIQAAFIAGYLAVFVATVFILKRHAEIDAALSPRTCIILIAVMLILIALIVITAPPPSPKFANVSNFSNITFLRNSPFPALTPTLIGGGI